MVSVGNQLLQVNNTVLNQANGSRPSVGVAVLVLEIDLLGAQAHEWDVHLVFADSDNENLAAELHTPDRRTDTTLHTGTLERQTRAQRIRTSSLAVVHGVDDSVRRLFGRVALLDLVGANAWCQRLGELQSPLVNVGNNDRSRSGSACAEHTDKTNGTSASDQQGISKTKATTFDGRKGNTERFQHSTILIAHVSDLVTPDSGVVDIATEETVHRRGRKEGDIFATVVSSRQAGFAGIADNVRLDRNTVADLEVGNIGGYSDDLTSGLVA